MARTGAAVAVAVGLLAAGCVVVAVGAGAGGGVYYTKRGVEALVDAPIRGKEALRAVGIRFAQAPYAETAGTHG